MRWFGWGECPPSLLLCPRPASVETGFLLAPPDVSNETFDPVFARSLLLMLSVTVFRASAVLGRLPAELERDFLSSVPVSTACLGGCVLMRGFFPMSLPLYSMKRDLSSSSGCNSRSGAPPSCFNSRAAILNYRFQVGLTCKNRGFSTYSTTVRSTTYLGPQMQQVHGRSGCLSFSFFCSFLCFGDTICATKENVKNLYNSSDILRFSLTHTTDSTLWLKYVSQCVTAI